jgi:hypothetical protein
MRMESGAPVTFAVVAVKLATGPEAAGVCAPSPTTARLIPTKTNLICFTR